MQTLPLETRAEVARHLIAQGEDPHMMLAAALWPAHVPVFVEQPTLNTDGTCANGHPWTVENTYVRKGRPGRKCRACEREAKRLHRRRYRARRKVPCAYCGEPATGPGDKGTGGLPTPRCRKCYMAQGGWWAQRRGRP